MASTSALIKSLLRIVTPEEINELTTTFDSHEKVALTDIMCGMLFHDEVSSEGEAEETVEDAKAKILPFQDPREKEIESIVVKCGENVAYLLANFTEAAKLNEGNLFSGKRLEKTYRPRPKQASSFIIEEKKKLEATYGKLKSKEVINLYQKNAAIDIESQKNNSEDLQKASQSGILVNKK